MAAVSATVLTIVVQPQPDDPPQEITSPEIHRTRVPGRPQQMEIFSPEAHRAPAPTTGRPTRPPTDRQLGVPAEPGAGSNISSPTDRQLGVGATSQSPHSGPVTGRHLLAEGYYTVPSASTPADPATSTAHALHTPNELATMRLVREGSLPTALLETDTFIPNGSSTKG